ncbi:uncharacterized protein LOC111269310 [Varroa jacobsoni]|uniref:uncharacterized protein LOC111269310 n=1 Tax=Varroa jacobsoni TaxID=62625 RepID=UPI000BF4E157|nr:uncharacterized protein LOC111269310 [Varroa jacobsoni]
MSNLLRCSRVMHQFRRNLGHRQVTSRFFDYFREQKHVLVPSSALLAPPETGVLFTNAGMNQFIRILSGSEAPWCSRAASLQDCVRIGGKHNDLGEVGRDGHHHTFFQMLGNWSFGDYFKNEACSFAFELLTSHYGIKKNQLVITYFSGDGGFSIAEDTETKNIWLSLGIPSKNIMPRGMEDNFWEMGQTGPCGTCTEIHVVSEGKLREIWNIVFVQYNRLSDGSLRTLETPFVDTGMGLERLCTILQGKKSNYDTDLFAPIIRQLEKDSGLSYSGVFGNVRDNAFRLIADHCRMVTKAMSQGILPDHRNAGNKLRRVLRRSIHAAQSQLGLKPGQLAELSEIAGDILDITGISEVKAIVNDEEKRYLTMLRKADAVLRTEQIESAAVNSAANNALAISGSTAWKLYLSCGLTQENIEDVCSQKSIKEIDWDGFNEHLQNFRKKSQSKSLSSTEDHIDFESHFNALSAASIPSTDQTKIYEHVYEMSSDVLYCADAGNNRQVLLLRNTCFFPGGGGQIPDVGTITTKDARTEYQVRHLEKLGDYVFHVIEGPSCKLRCGDEVILHVDQAHRRQCTWHHTACHLLNAGLKDQLGQGSHQHSTAVRESYFRLDVVTRTPVNVARLEEFVNSAIAADHLIQSDELAREEVLSNPRVVRIPGEIYPDKVRLVRCGDVSLEPCCGTHVSHTGEIPSVVVLSSRSLGVNLKSVTATAAKAAQAVENADIVLAKVSTLQTRVAQLSREKYPELEDCRRQMRVLRQEIANESLLPYLAVVDAEEKLHNIDRRIEQLIRNSNKLHEEKISALLSGLPHKSPLIGCISLDCDFAAVSKVLKERRDQDKSLRYFVALQSCGKVFVELCIPQQDQFAEQNATAWMASFIEALGPDGQLCTKIRSNATKSSKKDKNESKNLIRLRLNAPVAKEKVEEAARSYICKKISTKQPL